LRISLEPCRWRRCGTHPSPPQDGLTYSLPLVSASRLNPSMSLASLRLHSPWRTWGIDPGSNYIGERALKARLNAWVPPNPTHSAFRTPHRVYQASHGIPPETRECDDALLVFPRIAVQASS